MKKIIPIFIVIIAAIGRTLYAQSRNVCAREDKLQKQLAEWEQLAENGDTAAMHRLLNFKTKTLIFMLKWKKSWQPMAKNGLLMRSSA